MRVGDLVKLAHYGTLLHKEEFEVYAAKSWGTGLITQVLSGRRLDQCGLPVYWDQVEVLWPSRDILKIEDIEAVEVIN